MNLDSELTIRSLDVRAVNVPCAASAQDRWERGGQQRWFWSTS
jgi:hypothetical protein